MKTKKTADNVQYVLPLGNAWAVKSGDKNKFSLIAANKSHAITFARGIAKTSGAKLVIYGKRMQVLSTSNYVKKPASPRARS